MPHAHKIFKKKQILPAVVLIVSTFFLSMLVGAASWSAVMLANTPEDIVPTNVSSVEISVSRPDGYPLTWDPISALVGEQANYVDPNGLYSPIQAVVTDSWHSDQSGAFVGSDHVAPLADALLTPVRDAGGNIITYQIRYHYIVYMTVELLLRTGPANPIRYTPSTTFVSPCDGQLFTHDSTGAVPYVAEARGALTRYEYREFEWNHLEWEVVYKTNTMDVFNKHGEGPAPTHPAVSTHAPYADITTSVVPYMTWTDMIVPAVSSPLSTAAATKVTNIAPAAPVHVDATIHVVGNTGRISEQSSDFTYTLSDGTAATVQMRTMQAVVGFGMVGGMQNTGTYTGIVPNVNPLHQFPDYDLDDPSFASQHDPTPDEFTPGVVTTPDMGTGPITLEGSIRIKSVAPEVILPGGAVIGPAGNYPASNINLGQIESNCDLPSTLGIDVSTDMGAKLTANVATAEVRSTMAGSAGTGYAWDVRVRGDYINWACGLSVDNYMTAMNYTFPVDIVSERSLQFVSSDGEPIDLASIVDTDVNALFMDPRVDELYVTDTTPDMTTCTFNWATFDLWGYITCLIVKNWAQVWWVVVVLAIIAVLAGLWLFGKVATFFKGIIKIFKRH